MVKGGDGLGTITAPDSGGSGGNVTQAQDCYIWIRFKDGLRRYHETEARAIQLAYQNGGTPDPLIPKKCY